MQILITGTSRGLGSGLAAYYLDSGHEVWGISRTGNRNLEKYKNFHFLPQDISKPDEIKNSLAGSLTDAGRFDLVILNAGVLPPIKDMKDTSLDDIRKVMDVNVWANKVLIDLIILYQEPPKQIVAISSGASVYGNRGWNAYSLSKAALNMLIKLYSREQEKTHFSSVAPGLIDSAMQDYIFSLPEDPEFPSVSRLKKKKASGEMPSPEEAARIVADSLVKALQYESGSFLDVREM